MSDWAAETAERDSERQKFALIRMEKSIQDHKILMAGSKLHYARWRSLLRSKIEEFNGQPGKQNILNAEADAESCRIWVTSQPFSISGQFSGDTLQFIGNQHVHFEAAWRFRLTPDGLDVWIADNKNAPVTPDEIARTVIEAVLEARWQ